MRLKYTSENAASERIVVNNRTAATPAETLDRQCTGAIRVESQWVNFVFAVVRPVVSERRQRQERLCHIAFEPLIKDKSGVYAGVLGEVAA